jgi:hypothetical protein
MIARLSLPLILLAGIGLTACGKLGDLDQPPPLYGAQAKADYEAQQHARDAARARADAAAAPAPEEQDAPANSPPMQDAPYAPTIPGRNDTMTPQGPPGALPSPGQPNGGQ